MSPSKIMFILHAEKPAGRGAGVAPGMSLPRRRLIKAPQGRAAASAS
jgi:hypothetical protein